MTNQAGKRNGQFARGFFVKCGSPKPALAKPGEKATTECWHTHFLNARRGRDGRSDMADTVLQHITAQNRPFNAQNVADALGRHGIKKGLAQKYLDQLAESGKICVKESGKQRVFYALQDAQVMDAEQTKAMEADIDARHERQTRRRQSAHRAREAGNAAFKAGQFAEALKTYEKGLESDKRSIELHGNAAMAALKCGCFAQTIEHCDRACELAEFFLERPDHPTCLLYTSPSPRDRG